MPDAWDTSVASRVHGRSRHAGLLAAHLQAGRVVPLPAPTIQEIVRGLAPHAARNAAAKRTLRWFGQWFAHPLTRPVAFDRTAAELAGRLLARLPHPPARDRHRPGSRARQRAAWSLDVQIAACAFAGGYGVLTENVDDFATLRDTLAELMPEAAPLVVSAAIPNPRLEP